MTTSHLFPACLMLHLMALSVFTGTTLVDYLAHLSLCRSFGQNENTKPLLNLMAKLPRIGGIGAAILILSGFSMMALTHGVFGEQLWFKIKFGLVILIILNSTVIIRRQSGKSSSLAFASHNALSTAETAIAASPRLPLLRIAAVIVCESPGISNTF